MSDVLSYLVSQLFQIVGLDSVFRVSESNGVECLHENRVYIVIYSKSIYRDGYYQDVVQKMGIVLQIIYKQSGGVFLRFLNLDIVLLIEWGKLFMVLYLLPEVLMEEILFQLRTKLYLGIFYWFIYKVGFAE